MIHAAWPHSRTGRRLAARNRRLANALRTVLAEQEREKEQLREDLRVALDARAGDHAEILRLTGLVAAFGRQAALRDCPWPTDPDARHRQIHELADRLAEARKEIAYLEQVVARGRPRLMEREQ